MTPVPCNLCGVDDTTVKFPAGAAQVNQVVVCNRCSLMYASPRAVKPSMSPRLVYNVGVMSKSRAAQAALGRAAQALRFDRVSFSLNVRDMERIYLGKPS